MGKITESVDFFRMGHRKASEFGLGHEQALSLIRFVKASQTIQVQPLPYQNILRQATEMLTRLEAVNDLFETSAREQ